MNKYTIGGFLSAVSLNVVSQQDPRNWRHAVLSQFAFCGVALIAWAFLPESARWYCIGGREAECKKILQRVNGKVKGYDVDVEYRKMLVEVEHANAAASLQGGGSYLDVFRGTNRVGNTSVTDLNIANSVQASLDHFFPAVALAGCHRCSHYQYLFELLLRHGRAS